MIKIKYNVKMPKVRYTPKNSAGYDFKFSDTWMSDGKIAIKRYLKDKLTLLRHVPNDWDKFTLRPEFINTSMIRIINESLSSGGSYLRSVNRFYTDKITYTKIVQLWSQGGISRCIDIKYAGILKLGDRVFIPNDENKAILVYKDDVCIGAVMPIIRL